MGEQVDIARIKQGDQHAFKQLFDQYQTLVLNTCYGFVHDESDAKDLCQEVFIEVYKSIHRFREDSKISTWLYRIAVNKSLNYIRKNKRQGLSGSVDQLSNKYEDASLSSDTDAADINIENREREQALEMALSSLPKNQKIAFVLHKVEGVPYQEISEIMNVSISSVESLIHRAKKGLQKKLLNYYKKNCG